jgi:hypothetical protein
MICDLNLTLMFIWNVIDMFLFNFFLNLYLFTNFIIHFQVLYVEGIKTECYLLNYELNI